MTPILSTQDLVLRKGDTPENFDIGRGLTLLNTRRESNSTLLSLALAGRFNPHSGTILLDGEETRTRQRFKQIALAGVTEIDGLDRLVRIRDVVREQIAWSQSFLPAHRTHPRRSSPTTTWKSGWSRCSWKTST